MKDIAPTELNLVVKTEKKGKDVYSAPCFKVLGSVTRLTMGATGTRCDGSSQGGSNQQNNANGSCGSDPCIKENIARVGTHPMGFGMYLFDYKPEFRSIWGHGRQFGVMADEVKSVLPEAVVIHSDGYMMVNYALLGISRTVH